jgi:hypothetical protein
MLPQHLELVGEAMDLVVILGRDFSAPSSTWLSCWASACSTWESTAFKLALAGYYQAGFRSFVR